MQQSGEKRRGAPDDCEPGRAADILVRAVAVEMEALVARPPDPGLWLVATPIGHLGDISLRALAVLATADVLYCEDCRHSRTLLARFGIARPTRPYHEHNGARERPAILALLGEGRSVAIVSDAGTPLVSDPGYKLARAAIDAGHAVHALPGPSAVLAGLCVSGLATDCFLFAGFLPPKEGARERRLGELATVPATLVLFEAPGRLGRMLQTAADVLGPRQGAVTRELTKKFEEIRRGTLPELAAWALETEIKGEIAVVIAAPTPAAVDEAAICAALAEATQTLSLRDATQAVAARLGVPKTLVYDLALKMKQQRRDVS